MTDFSIGVEVGKDYARAGVLPAIRARNSTPRMLGQSVHMKRFEEASPHETVLAITALIKDAIAKARQDSGIALGDDGFRGLGLSLPDPIEPLSGTITYPTQHPQWRNAQFRDLLANQLSHDPFIVVDNDANMAAYGEYLLERQSSPIKHLVYVVCGAGIGAGIIINGGVYAGYHGFAGEFGHTVVDPNSTFQCAGCRQYGCVDVLGSGTAIARVFADVNGRADPQKSAPGEQSNPVTLVTLARNGQYRSDDGRVVYATGVLEQSATGGAQANQAVEQAARYLGVGLVTLYHTLDPELVILGGIPNLSSRYYDVAVQCMQAHVHPAIQGNHPIRVSRLGLDASLIGAALRAEDLWIM